MDTAEKIDGGQGVTRWIFWLVDCIDLLADGVAIGNGLA
jgi:hypothetical protein